MLNAEMSIINSTIANNLPVDQNSGSGVLIGNASGTGGTLVISNSILWGNEATSGSQVDDLNDIDIVEIYDSIVENGWTGTGSNILDEDPEFINSEEGNYSLLAFSPAIDNGANADLPCNEFGLDPDEEVDALGGCPTTVDNPSGRKHPIDLLDNQRVLNLADVDMGAFEFQCEVAACPGDFNDDGTVDVSDILEMLAVFGSCPAPCPADLNCDGNVNVSDLLALLGAFGPCPALGSEDAPEDVYDCMDRYEVGTEEFEKCIEWIEQRENYLE